MYNIISTVHFSLWFSELHDIVCTHSKHYCLGTGTSNPSSPFNHVILSVFVITLSPGPFPAYQHVTLKSWEWVGHEKLDMNQRRYEMITCSLKSAVSSLFISIYLIYIHNVVKLQRRFSRVIPRDPRTKHIWP